MTQLLKMIDVQEENTSMKHTIRIIFRLSTSTQFNSQHSRASLIRTPTDDRNSFALSEFVLTEVISIETTFRDMNFYNYLFVLPGNSY